jgi:hydrogenase nickel incorporation protein HypA/HybF
MHEVSIAESLVDLIEDQARKEGFGRVNRIAVKLGALSHVEAAALEFCFDAASRGTVAEGARLEIRLAPASGWCPRCEREVAIAQRYDLCPSCGETFVRMTAGDELQLTELGVE